MASFTLPQVPRNEDEHYRREQFDAAIKAYAQIIIPSELGPEKEVKDIITDILSPDFFKWDNPIRLKKNLDFFIFIIDQAVRFNIQLDYVFSAFQMKELEKSLQDYYEYLIKTASEQQRIFENTLLNGALKAKEGNLALARRVALYQEILRQEALYCKLRVEIRELSMVLGKNFYDAFGPLIVGNKVGSEIVSRVMEGIQRGDIKLERNAILNGFMDNAAYVLAKDSVNADPKFKDERPQVREKEINVRQIEIRSHMNEKALNKIIPGLTDQVDQFIQNNQQVINVLAQKHEQVNQLKDSLYSLNNQAKSENVNNQGIANPNVKQLTGFKGEAKKIEIKHEPNGDNRNAAAAPANGKVNQLVHREDIKIIKEPLRSQRSENILQPQQDEQPAPKRRRQI